MLARLLARADASKYEITTLVRSPEKAKKLETFGVKAVVGSIKDIALLTRLAEQAHIVFSLVDCDDNDQAQAVVAGLKKRHNATGDIPIVIHASGTGELVFGHNTQGMAVTDTIYDDADIEQIKSISPEAPHRAVTLTFVNADTEGWMKTYIVMPGMIYGAASSPLVDAGIQYSRSRGLPLGMNPTISRGRPGVIGKGLTVWATVHVEDTADLFLLLWDAIVSHSDKAGHGWEGFYIVGSGEMNFHDIAKETGRVMVELGLSTTDEVTPLSPEEVAKFYPPGFDVFFSSCSRGRGTHSYALGWKPKYTNKDFIASIRDEVDLILKGNGRESF